MVRFLLLIFLIFNITLSSKAKEPIDSLSLKCCSVKIYRSIDSMYLEKSNLDGVFNSHLAFELAVEIEKNKSFFKFYSLDIINSLFDVDINENGELFIEESLADEQGKYYGASLIFENYKGIIMDIRIINR